MAALARNIPRLIDASKSNATLRKYKSYFSKFESWCSINKLSSLPATPATVSLFISHLVQCKSSSSVLSSVFYAVQWYHDKNLFPNPCSDKLVKLTFEGALRTLSKTSINKKQPITSNIISKVLVLRTMLLIYLIYELDCCLFLVLPDFSELESCAILEDRTSLFVTLTWK